LVEGHAARRAIGLDDEHVEPGFGQVGRRDDPLWQAPTTTTSAERIRSSMADLPHLNLRERQIPSRYLNTVGF